MADYGPKSGRRKSNISRTIMFISRIIVAVEGPGNVPGIAKDVADFMGWIHISLEDLLIYSDDPVCGDAITSIAQGIPVNVQTL